MGNAQTPVQPQIQPVGVAQQQQPEKKAAPVKSGGLWDDKSSNLFDLSSGGLTVKKEEAPQK